MFIPLKKFLAEATATLDSILAKYKLGDVDTVNDMVSVLAEVCKVACLFTTHASILDTLSLWFCCSQRLLGNSAYMFMNALSLLLTPCFFRNFREIQENRLWRQPASAAPTGMQRLALRPICYKPACLCTCCGVWNTLLAQVHLPLSSLPSVPDQRARAWPVQVYRSGPQGNEPAGEGVLCAMRRVVCCVSKMRVAAYRDLLWL